MIRKKLAAPRVRYWKEKKKKLQDINVPENKERPPLLEQKGPHLIQVAAVFENADVPEPSLNREFSVSP